MTCTKFHYAWHDGLKENYETNHNYVKITKPFTLFTARTNPTNRIVELRSFENKQSILLISISYLFDVPCFFLTWPIKFHIILIIIFFFLTMNYLTSFSVPGMVSRYKILLKSVSVSICFVSLYDVIRVFSSPQLISSLWATKFPNVSYWSEIIMKIIFFNPLRVD